MRNQRVNTTGCGLTWDKTSGQALFGRLHVVENIWDGQTFS